MTTPRTHGVPARLAVWGGSRAASREACFVGGLWRKVVLLDGVERYLPQVLRLQHRYREAFEIEQMIRNGVLLAVKQARHEAYVPAAVSNRHAHLDQKTVNALFGDEYILKKHKDLSQPGQYACEEFVTLEGPKGSLSLRALGPVRPETQVELSVSDARGVGVNPELRLSGDLSGTPGAALIGPAGRVRLERGVIVAARHLHISPKQAEAYGLQDGDRVRLLAEGPRGVVLENVVVRAGDGHDLELHIDFDEANCAMIVNGSLLKIID